MDVKFTVVSQNNLATVEHSDGQIIVVWDTPGMFYDMNDTRYSVIGATIEVVNAVPTTSTIAAPNPSVLYVFVDGDDYRSGVYIYDEVSSDFTRIAIGTSKYVRMSQMTASSGNLYFLSTGSTSPGEHLVHNNSSVKLDLSTNKLISDGGFQGNLDGKELLSTTVTAKLATYGYSSSTDYTTTS